ncbi:hypothetical protein Tco_1105852 [Tanacetum coccineum]
MLLAKEKLIKAIRTCLKNNNQPPEEKSIVVLLAEESILTVMQTLEEKQIDTESMQELLLQFSKDLPHSMYDETSSSDAITSDLPITDSLVMEDEHLDTIPETDNESILEEDVFSNLPSEFDEEYISSDVNIIYDEVLEDIYGTNYLIDSIIDFSPKIDPLLEEFAGELALINPIPPRIAGADSYPEGDIRLVEKLLNDNSSHRTPDELNSEDIIEFFFAFPIPVEDSYSLLEKTNTILSYLDDSLPELETFSFDVEEKNSGSTTTHADISLLEYDCFYFDIELNITGDPLSPVLETLLPFSSEIKDKVFNPGILVSKEEKSPHLLSHRGFKAFKIIHNFLNESPMMIYGGDMPILDVPYLYFYPP